MSEHNPDEHYEFDSDSAVELAKAVLSNVSVDDIRKIRIEVWREQEYAEQIGDIREMNPEQGRIGVDGHVAFGEYVARNDEKFSAGDPPGADVTTGEWDEDEEAGSGGDSDGANRAGYDPETGEYDLDRLFDTRYHEILTYLWPHNNRVSSTDIADGLGYSTTGELSRMHDADLIDRDERTHPYEYEISENGRDVIRQIGPAPDTGRRSLVHGTDYHRVFLSVLENPGSSTKDVATDTGVELNTVSANVSELYRRALFERVDTGPYRYEVTPYGEQFESRERPWRD